MIHLKCVVPPCLRNGINQNQKKNLIQEPCPTCPLHRLSDPPLEEVPEITVVLVWPPPLRGCRKASVQAGGKPEGLCDSAASLGGERPLCRLLPGQVLGAVPRPKILSWALYSPCPVQLPGKTQSVFLARLEFGCKW